MTDWCEELQKLSSTVPFFRYFQFAIVKHLFVFLVYFFSFWVVLIFKPCLVWNACKYRGHVPYSKGQRIIWFNEHRFRIETRSLRQDSLLPIWYIALHEIYVRLSWKLQNMIQKAFQWDLHEIANKIMLGYFQHFSQRQRFNYCNYVECIGVGNIDRQKIAPKLTNSYRKENEWKKKLQHYLVIQLGFFKKINVRVRSYLSILYKRELPSFDIYAHCQQPPKERSEPPLSAKEGLPSPSRLKRKEEIVLPPVSLKSPEWRTSWSLVLHSDLVCEVHGWPWGSSTLWMTLDPEMPYFHKFNPILRENPIHALKRIKTNSKHTIFELSHKSVDIRPCARLISQPELREFIKKVNETKYEYMFSKIQQQDYFLMFNILRKHSTLNKSFRNCLHLTARMFS